MSGDSIVGGIIDNVPKAVAAGVIDMGTGLLLAVKTTTSHPQEVLDLLAAATKDLFEGDTVMGIEETFKQIRGDTREDHYFQEIIVTSANLLHVFARLKTQPGIVITAVTRVDANLGLVVMKMREIAKAETV